MGRTSRLTILIALMGITSGCNSLIEPISKDMRPSPLATYNVASLKYAGTDGSKLSSSSTSFFSENSVPVFDYTILLASTPNGAGSDQTALSERRNLIQDLLIQRSDKLCAKYLDAMYIRITARDFALTEFSKVSNLISTFVGGAAGQSWGLATSIANATNDAYNEKVLRNQVSQLISNKIRSNRKAILERIRANQFMGGTLSSINKYPISTALSDAYSYHNACSYLTGLEGLTSASTQADPTSAATIGNPTVPPAQ